MAKIKLDTYVPCNQGVMMCLPQDEFVPNYNELGGDCTTVNYRGRATDSYKNLELAFGGFSLL